MLFTEAQSSRAVVEKMATVGTISIRGTGGRPSSGAACRALNFVFSSDYLKNVDGHVDAREGVSKANLFRETYPPSQLGT